MPAMQKLLIITGALLLVAGLAWPWLDRLRLGRLPGDIVLQREGVTFYFPITTMVLLSVLISFVFWVMRR